MPLAPSTSATASPPIRPDLGRTRDRVDIRPTATLLRRHVDRYGTDATCHQFDLCRRRLGAIVSLRTTRGKHAHFLERSCVEDILTHSAETFGVMHVPLTGRLQTRLADLLLTSGAETLAAQLGISLPRSEQFVQQIAGGRAGNGARVTHVCRSIAERAGIDPAILDDLAIERGWCPTCHDHVLVSPDRHCPWCDTAVSVTHNATGRVHTHTHTPRAARTAPRPNTSPIDPDPPPPHA